MATQPPKTTKTKAPAPRREPVKVAYEPLTPHKVPDPEFDPPADIIPPPEDQPE